MKSKTLRRAIGIFLVGNLFLQSALLSPSAFGAATTAQESKASYEFVRNQARDFIQALRTLAFLHDSGASTEQCLKETACVRHSYENAVAFFKSGSAATPLDKVIRTVLGVTEGGTIARGIGSFLSTEALIYFLSASNFVHLNGLWVLPPFLAPIALLAGNSIQPYAWPSKANKEASARLLRAAFLQELRTQGVPVPQKDSEAWLERVSLAVTTDLFRFETLEQLQQESTRFFSAVDDVLPQFNDHRGLKESLTSRMDALQKLIVKASRCRPAQADAVKGELIEALMTAKAVFKQVAHQAELSNKMDIGAVLTGQSYLLDPFIHPADHMSRHMAREMSSDSVFYSVLEMIANHPDIVVKFQTPQIILAADSLTSKSTWRSTFTVDTVRKSSAQLSPLLRVTFDFLSSGKTPEEALRDGEWISYFRSAIEPHLKGQADIESVKSIASKYICEALLEEPAMQYQSAR